MHLKIKKKIMIVETLTGVLIEHKLSKNTKNYSQVLNCLIVDLTKKGDYSVYSNEEKMWLKLYTVIIPNCSRSEFEFVLRPSPKSFPKCMTDQTSKLYGRINISKRRFCIHKRSFFFEPFFTLKKNKAWLFNRF